LATSSSHSFILQYRVFFCGCRNGKTYSSRTSRTGGLPFVKNYLNLNKAPERGFFVSRASGLVLKNRSDRIEGGFFVKSLHILNGKETSMEGSEVKNSFRLFQRLSRIYWGLKAKS